MRAEREVATDEKRLLAVMQKWADGRATLKDVRGYTDEELFTIARVGYVFYTQGRIAEARTLFQGLYALDPLEPYFAKALGVVEFAAGNSQGALSAYDVAIKLNPDDPAAFVGRAEIRLALGHKSQALEDLVRAGKIVSEEDPQKPKIFAMLESLRK